MRGRYHTDQYRRWIADPGATVERSLNTPRMRIREWFLRLALLPKLEQNFHGPVAIPSALYFEYETLIRIRRITAISPDLDDNQRSN
ncbi:MAG TPA: hypothetical protein VJT15_00470 [Pyrinomonadaceae bacterium]|nr:hypothetical protein [Pyrinomonadaceae bacterium]